MEVNRKEIIIIEPPTNFTFRNVMFWEPESKSLVQLKQNGDKAAATKLTKAEKFLACGCIERINDISWKCKPIKGYNKTTYLIQVWDEQWKCNCQGFKMYNDCSHILAVKQFIFMEKQ